MNQIIERLKSENQSLADETFYEGRDHELIEVDMLIVMDITQYFSLSIQKYGGVFCFTLNGKVAPVGNALNFLTFNQRKALFESQIKAVHVSNKTKTMVNLIMDPLKSYFNPLEHILSDSEVDNGLENLFSFKSMGIKTCDKELVSFDKQQIDKFQEGISLKDGSYHVKLPWYPEKNSKVPSNHFIALRVLDRTMKHLNRKGLLSKYEKVFDKQLEDDIIEEINASPFSYNDYTWIPHRPVIRKDEQVTTKTRPVFDCSLKTNNELPSLNEAAYTGIDLIGSILKLLFYFRTNEYVMLSDIKQAFLMVKLADEYDNNRFCFFWKRGNRLVCYRYKTIVFGYTSSPFILNYVMKHHAKSYPEDKCREILDNNFYVDNLVVTGHNINELHELYKLCSSRMQEGRFTLRSWNSNAIELRETMKADGKLVEHKCTEEKVLGYRYNVNSDTLSLAPCSVEAAADTKRKVLSQISKVFDTLNFTLTVTVTSPFHQSHLNWVHDPVPPPSRFMESRNAVPRSESRVNSIALIPRNPLDPIPSASRNNSSVNNPSVPQPSNSVRSNLRCVPRNNNGENEVSAVATRGSSTALLSSAPPKKRRMRRRRQARRAANRNAETSSAAPLTQDARWANQRAAVPAGAMQPLPENSDPTSARRMAVYPPSRIVGDSLANENSPFQIGLESSRISGLYKPAIPDQQQDTQARPFRVNNSGSGTPSPPYLLPYTKPFSGRPAGSSMTSPTQEAGETLRSGSGIVYPLQPRPSPRHAHHHGRRPP